MTRIVTLIAALAAASIIISGCGGGGGGGSSAPTGNTITGTVVASGTSAALPGVVVTVVGANKTATTAANGSFTITGLAAGAYTFTFTKTGYNTVNRQITVLEGSNPSIEQTMSPAGTSNPPDQGIPRDIEGTVLLQGSTDNSGVTAELLSGSTVVETFSPTPSDGKYHFWVTPGAYKVRLSKTGYTTFTTANTYTVTDIGKIVQIPTVTLQKL